MGSRLSDDRADGRTNRRMDGRTDGRTDGWTNRRTDGRTDARTHGWTDGRTDGRTDSLSVNSKKSDSNETHNEMQCNHITGDVLVL